MIYFEKTQPPPPCLAIEKAKTNGDYKCEGVLEKLKNDFHNKCYICEQKAPTTINVEHFVAHQGDKDLKFDWNNLFWACGHCNNIKLAKFNDILNCTVKSELIETKLKYKPIFFPKEIVYIEALDSDLKTQNTQKLLTLVYNGSTEFKHIQAENIKRLLRNEINDFRAALEGYFEYENDNEQKDYFLHQIKLRLSKSSAFTAFKQWIIRDNVALEEEFGHLL